jgi:hypothetical protein
MLFDDKNLVIIASTIIACWAMAIMGVNAKDVVIPIVSMLGGIAVGQATKT